MITELVLAVIAYIAPYVVTTESRSALIALIEITH